MEQIRQWNVAVMNVIICSVVLKCKITINAKHVLILIVPEQSYNPLCFCFVKNVTRWGAMGAPPVADSAT